MTALNAPSRFLEPLLLAAAFALAHTQSPLYYSNQNQYLLHGLALANYGHLRGDWLANTRDPTPAFSWLVAATYSVCGAWGFQVEYFALVMAYFLSFRSLVHALPGIPDTRSFRLGWAALFTTAHAALLRVVSVKLTGIDLPWYLQAGVASQYLLGPGLQPSAFGFLLITGLAAFARGRPVLGCAVAAASAVMHSTYLLPAGLLTLGVMVALWIRGERRGAAFSGAAALAVVSPVIAYTLVAFAPTELGTFHEANRILAEIRIPHHCVISRWLDFITWLQVGWMIAGLYLLRRTAIVPVLAVMAGGGLILTLVQAATENPSLALLFPWRVSVVLVPVATAVIFARLAALERPGRVVEIAAAVLLFLLALGGIVVMSYGLGYQMTDEEALFSYVRANAGPDKVYLLPMRFPAVGTGRGAVSNTFTPPPRPKPGSNQIPVDLLRFRLHTGAPVYVDFKSVPYADAEVVEWHRRMEQCQKWYDGNWSRPGMRDELVREGITHVVMPQSRQVVVPYLELVHRDPTYVVYKVK
jgi:hypothetical protein